MKVVLDIITDAGLWHAGHQPFPFSPLSETAVIKIRAIAAKCRHFCLVLDKKSVLFFRKICHNYLDLVK